jgi:hypothetical protein
MQKKEKTTSKISIPFSCYHGKIPSKMGKPMVNDHYPIIQPVDPGRSQIPQLFP